VEEDTSPAALAIKALQLWQAGATENDIHEQLNIFLQQKGVKQENISALLEAATPIIQGLRTAFQPAQAPQQPAVTNPTTPPSPSALHQRPRFPDPEPFDGTRALYPVFKQKAKAKIYIDGAIYGTEQGQVNYLFSRLISTAAKTVLPWLNSNALYSMEDFWNFMDSRFSDPQAKAKALDKLQSMKQKTNEDVRDYLARFEGELLESEVIMDDAVKISTFTRGLKIQVQKDIAMVNNTIPFQEYCKEIIRIQDAHRRINFLNKQPFITSKPAPTPHQYPNAMDWEPTQAHMAQPLANTNRRAKWVNPEEIQRRRSNRLCIRCGASGHMISSCQYAPARRPSSNITTAITRVLEEPQLEEEELEPGKE